MTYLGNNKKIFIKKEKKKRGVNHIFTTKLCSQDIHIL